MEEFTTSKNARRSSRIMASIPVEVYCREGDGREIHVQTNTNLVNKHGARFTSKHSFPIDSEVILSIPNLQKQQHCRVAWVSLEADSQGYYEVAVELEHPENFFAVQFAPDDWNISSSIPRVDAPSSDSVSHSEMREYELQRLSTVMNALIALLVNKGVLTRAELAEILKQEN